MTVHRHFILVALLASFTSSCHIFEDIKDLDSDSGIENPGSEDTNNESLRGEEETDPNQKKDGQKSTDADKPDSKDTDDSDSKDTGKTDPTDTDETDPTDTDKPDPTDTDTKENITVCKDSELNCEEKCVPNDIRNCGKCGHDCTALPHVGDQVECTQGVCTLTKSSCDNGWAHCVEDPDKGCETDITAASNCGGCGNDCTETDKKLCTPKDDGYECAVDCPSNAPTQCGDICVNTDDSTSHCGKCYNECNPLFNSQPVCKDGECGIECDDSDYLECPNGCFPKDDNEHCGDCARNCKKNNEVCDSKGNCVECVVNNDCKGNDAKLCIKNECKQCESGSCCDTSTNLYHRDSHVCETPETKYKCKEDGKCGSAIQKYSTTKYCSGESSNCDGRKVTQDWTDDRYCAELEICTPQGSKEPICASASHECSCTNFEHKYDPDENICWQNPKSSGTYTQSGAKDYCDSLSLSNQNDWRLPSREEFVEMLGGCDSDVKGGDPGFCNSCSNSETCRTLFGLDNVWYWASDDICQAGYCWTVNFKTGEVVAQHFQTKGNVRCVR